VKARALFANADDALFPNQFVNTRLLLTTLHDATLVPHSAIQQNGDSSFVYVIDGGQAHNRPVKPGATENGITQVDGLSPGDVLANSSFDKLHDGALVTVAAAPPGQAAPPPASQAP
jgi:multidrug efflux system membrane fusion protein